MELTLAIILAAAATANMCYLWVLRNYSILSVEWLTDLAEFLNEDDTTVHEHASVTRGAIPTVKELEMKCMLNFIPGSCVWAITTIFACMLYVDISDPFITFVACIGVAYISVTMYDLYANYCTVANIMQGQQITYNTTTGRNTEDENE